MKKFSIKELKEKINEIPISQIIGSRITLQKGKTLCPFHEDSSAGSFQYSDKKNYFKCFACDESGNGIDFIMKYDKVTFTEAVLRIAKEFGFIKPQEYKKRSKNVDQMQRENQVAKTITNKQIELERKDNSFLNFTYRQMMKLLPLNEEHKKYLLGRGLSQEDIINGEYFSFNGTDITDKLISVFAGFDLAKIYLLGVPGFYYADNKIKMQKLNGVGIPIKNYAGQVVALQVRKDFIKEKEARYVFFSSGSLSYGASCGGPVGVMYPKEPNKICYITEGHFKADCLSKTYNSIVIGLQGVNNIKGLGNDLQSVLYNDEIDTINIAFDMDMYKNIEVFKASVRLAQMIERISNESNRHIKINYVIWNPKYGKGIDDCIQAGHCNKVISLPVGYFQRCFIDYVNETLLANDLVSIKQFKLIDDNVKWNSFNKKFKCK